jgi:branched-chain amino acid transport system substrate-binding protein
MKLYVWVLYAAVAALAIIAVACTDGGGNGGSATNGCGSAPEDVEDVPASGDILTAEQILTKDPGVTKQAVLNWGWMFELSGPPQVQGFGEPTSDGVKLAVQEINEAGGFQVGDTIYTINLVERDTQSDVSRTIAATTELVQDEKVCVIFGPATLGEPEATQITQQARIIHLCPCQQREKTALDTVEKANNESLWAFQTLLPFSLLSDNGARNFIRDYPELHTMALICQSSETGRDICERTKTAYENVGVEVVHDIIYFPVGTTDYSPFLTQLVSADPDYLFNFDDPLQTTTIVRQALELGIGRLHLVTVPANLVEGLVGREITVPVTAGAAPRQHFQPTSEEAGEFFDRYREYKGGELPLAAFVSLMTYDYAYMLAGAMQAAGTVDDSTKIAKALATLHYDGIAEDDLFFNSRHLAVHGTEGCVVLTGEPIVCTHEPPPPEAAE